MTNKINLDNPVIASTDNELSNAPLITLTTSTTSTHLPPQGMSRASQLLPFLPFGSSTLWAWSRDGRFPAPVKLSPTMTAWRNADVIDWLNSQITSTTSEV